MEAKDKFIFPEFDSPKNYPEDYADGHNQYVCKCYKCKEHFYGYKRRIICKECLNTEESENEIMEGKAKEALKEILDRCNNGIRLLNQVLEDKKSSSIEKNRASYQLNILKMFKGIAECGLMEDIVKGNINSGSSN